VAEEVYGEDRLQVVKHLRAILLLPFMVIVVIPGAILWLSGPDTLNLWRSVPLTRVCLPISGCIFICLGLGLMVTSIRLFVTVGEGTLAPWNPTQRLVVRGVYHHIRNPMISGVFFILLGEATLTASLPLFGWFLIFVIGCAIIIPLAEEPDLVKRFGEEYIAYKQNVPRWIPRLRPWEGDKRNERSNQ